PARRARKIGRIGNRHRMGRVSESSALAPSWQSPQEVLAMARVPWLRTPPTGQPRPRGRRPRLEALEDRVLPAGISGAVFHDLNADGNKDSGEPTQAGSTL